ncbi:MAG: hypothetical protein ACKPKO_58890, partial [Candidatus Fonsibacter sp.]
VNLPVDVLLCPLTVLNDAVIFPLYDSKFPYADTFPIDDVIFPKVDVISPTTVNVPTKEPLPVGSNLHLSVQPVGPEL